MEKLIYKIEINEIAKFLERPNRFICNAKLKNGDIVTGEYHYSFPTSSVRYPHLVR